MKFELRDVEVSITGSKRPKDKMPLSEVGQSFPKPLLRMDSNEHPANALKDESIVIAAITSCTNTSNPFNMIGAGLLAKKAVELGLTVSPNIQSSLAPGSKIVT